MEKIKRDENAYLYTHFTSKGYKTFMNLLKNLIRHYFYNDKYPYELQVLGIPRFKYASRIESHKDMLGRIKMLGQLLGVQEITFKIDEKTVNFDMKGEFTIK